MAVSIRELGEQVARIDARTREINDHLDGLTRMIARDSSGRTLINLVGEILTKVNSL